MSTLNKKIDVVVKYFYPVAAGIETNVMETYSVLQKDGWDVTIHTSKDIHTKKNILPNEEVIRRLAVKRYPFTIFGYKPNINWSSTGIVALHNFDIFPHLRILVHSLFLKILRKKKFVLILTPHGGFNPEWSVFKKSQRYIKYFYHYTIGVFLINAVVDGVRAVSEWEKQEMIKKGIKESLIVVIDNGLEDEAYMDLEKEASNDIKNKVSNLGDYIVQVGRIYPIKNYETTLQALTKIPAHIKYAIIGPISDEKYLLKLQNLIRDLGLTDRVIFMGVIRGVDKYYAIKHGLMMVHMALWESFCNVVHEGLSQGLPCIVANNTALPLLIKDGVNGYCVETHDTLGVAEKINFIYSHQNDEVIKNMRKINTDFGLRNSWQEVAGRMNEWYSRLQNN